MKKQASVWIVTLVSLVALGVVYALATTPPPGRKAAVTNQPAQSQPVQPVQTATTLSPDLTKVDAYAFLDPVPVGKPAPDFTAVTATGKTVRLSDFKGKKNVVLVFYQGSFCSVCAAQLSNLQKHLGDFKLQNAEILAISADDKTHAMQSVGENGLSFHVIPDADKAIIQKFGVNNIAKQGIAWPSLFVVDTHGIVRLSFASRDGHRLHSNEILPALSKITGKPAPKLGYNE